MLAASGPFPWTEGPLRLPRAEPLHAPAGWTRARLQEPDPSSPTVDVSSPWTQFLKSRLQIACFLWCFSVWGPL